MDTEINDFQIQILPSVCGDLFSFASYLRESRSYDRDDTLYEGILELFFSMEKRARDAKIPEEDIQEARYAIAAFYDETLKWESRLERRFFNSSIAGDEFFDKLDQMLERVKGTEPPYGVLEVYYICLTLGFGGRYIGESSKLQRYIRKLQEILKAETTGKLSPNGERPAETIQKQRSRIPSWAMYAVAGAGVLIIVFALIFFKIRMADWANNAVSQIQSFLH
jgi:type VI secretion system protein ImpK